MSRRTKPDYISDILDSIEVQSRKSLQATKEARIEEYQSETGRLKTFLVNFNVIILMRCRQKSTVNINCFVNTLLQRHPVLRNKVLLVEAVLREHEIKVRELENNHPYPFKDSRLVWEHYLSRFTGLKEIKEETAKKLKELLSEKSTEMPLNGLQQVSVYQSTGKELVAMPA